MKNKKIIISVIIAIILIIAIVAVFIILNMPKEKPEEVVSKYFGYINDKNYDAMYEMINKNSKSMISKEDFIARNKNIYEGIDASNIEINIQEVTKENNKKVVSYQEEMVTSAGNVTFSNEIDLYKEDKQYKIDWSSNLIFPELQDDYKVRVETLEGKRGSILDRYGNELAYDGTISSVGIVPGKLGDNKDENISKISELTGVSVETINNLLSASYVQDDTFVPVKKISKDNQTTKEQLLQIPGVQINDTPGRVYTLGEEAGHLIGYVQTINAEELEGNKDKGYSSTSLIGKSGLESAYEDRLRGTDGVKIYIIDENGNEIKEIAKQEQKDGEDIKLTIDSNIQKTLYNELKNDKGLFVVMQPKTGELLALVSTPTFNSNDFTLGMTNDKWNELNSNEAKPLYNRFTASYCPGSTFKAITGAIGLTTGKIDANEDFGYTGTSWQKDSSWGDYKVTTLTPYSGPKNLLNGLIHSDNIYFAQAALKIGTSTFTESLDKIYFNKQIEFPLTLAKSQYANDEGINSEGKLADSGFGQGNILVNPIHMASIYSSFANDGNMIKPYIEYKENKEPEILVENAFSQEAANTIKEDLIQVVENPKGTANDMKVNGVTIAGKTGTAELKQDKEDTESGTLGWFNCFTTDQGDNDKLIIGMVENVQNNSDGGSHYLIKMIRKLFE